MAEIEAAMEACECEPVAVVYRGVEIVAAANVVRGARMATVAKCCYDVELNGGVCGKKAVSSAATMVSGCACLPKLKRA